MAGTEVQAPSARPGAAEFTWPVRVYYEDTDSAGVVYHSNYLKYMERARTEWLRALGFSQQRLREDEDILFVVTNMSIRFQRPARFDEQLNVTTRLNNMNAASLNFTQSIYNDDAEPICTAEVAIACLHAVSLKPRRIPDAIKETFHHGG
jgi:acyl-CoA thioester hydrolase